MSLSLLMKIGWGWLAVLLLIDLNTFLTPGVLIGACSAVGAILVYWRGRKKDKVDQSDLANTTAFGGMTGLISSLQRDNRDLRDQVSDYRAEVIDLRRRLEIAEGRLEEIAELKRQLALAENRLADAERRILLLMETIRVEREGK